VTETANVAILCKELVLFQEQARTFSSLVNEIASFAFRTAWFKPLILRSPYDAEYLPNLQQSSEARLITETRR